MFFIIICAAFLQLAVSQKIGSVGTVGGRGPTGGIGDEHRPVKTAAAFITDALIPTTPNSTRQLAKGLAPVKLKAYPKSSSPEASFYNVVIDAKSGARQELLGFGHSWTDSAVEVLGSLEPAIFDQAMNDLFEQEGNNMGLMRHTIGSSDLSYDQYSYDDNGPSFNGGTPDPDLANFDIGDRGRAMADMIARMSNYKSDVTQFGSPWSAPSWMKRNGLFIAPELNVPNGGAYYYTNNTFDSNYIPQYAQYFAKYIDALENAGPS
jgi:O-glycosyl hydrolase